MKLIFFLSICLTFSQNLFAIQWPLKDFSAEHDVSGTLGGWRTLGLHDGTDILSPAGTPVYAVKDGSFIQQDRIHQHHRRSGGSLAWKNWVEKTVNAFWFGKTSSLLISENSTNYLRLIDLKNGRINWRTILKPCVCRRLWPLCKQKRRCFISYK